VSTLDESYSRVSRRVDNHSHIIHCGIEDMFAAAKRNNLQEFSITEHVSQFAVLRRSVEFGSIHASGRMFESREEYIEEFRRIDLRTRGVVKLNRGLEVDFSPRFLDSVGDFVNRAQWDILLCSVHEFGDGRDVERRTRARGLTDQRNRWETYFQLQAMALESSFVPFKVLAHPVRMSKGTSWIPEEINEMLTNLSAVAKKNGKALELNGNDIDYNPKLVRLLASSCSKTGCLVSLGSDAHYPKDVFRNVDIAIRLVDEFKLELA
jgi:HisJ family histidinol phosphate phosphatase